jgi:ferredoxin
MDPVVEPISEKKMRRVERGFRVARRIELLGYVLPIAYVLLMPVYLLLLRNRQPPGWLKMIMSYGIYRILIMVFLHLAATGVRFAASRQLARRLIESRCQTCPSCGYSLQGRPRDELACPECAYEISRRECVRRWCKMLRSGF